MGRRIPKPPVEHGNDCGACTPARWPAGETPKYIYCMFWGIEDCGVSPHPAPNGDVFRMEQDPTSPCYYFVQGDVWHPNFSTGTPGVSDSRLQLIDHHGFGFFTKTGPACPDEYITYPNAQIACVLMLAGAKGWGTIFWNNDVETMSEQFGLRPGFQLFYELFKSEPFYYVHKFCDLHQRTNIKVQRNIFF